MSAWTNKVCRSTSIGMRMQMAKLRVSTALRPAASSAKKANQLTWLGCYTRKQVLQLSMVGLSMFRAPITRNWMINVLAQIRVLTTENGFKVSMNDTTGKEELQNVADYSQA